ncbi:MAG: glycosyltransferase family 1 protein [Planctomycetes bacterium]|nr:glycosyltransferase family 1 protein [Planctomycetota bacterium]
MPLRIALTTLGSLGDLHPFLEVGRELRRRGHRVTLATSPTYEPRVIGAGLEFVAIPPDYQPGDPQVLDAVLDRWRGAERLHKEFVFPHLRAALDAFEPLARESDVVVRSVLTYFASIAAECAGVPWMSMQLSPLCLWSAHEPPLLAPIPWLAGLPLGPKLHGLLLRGMLKISEPWARPVRRLRAERGLPYHGNPFSQGQFAGVATIAAFSPEFYPPQPDWPARVVQTGFVFHDESGPLEPGLEAFLQAGEPPAVFTLGSTAVHDPGPALARMTEAARATGRRCVVLVGEARLPEFEALATELVWIGGYAPYAALFSRAALVVHQGGVGTTAQVMRAGCTHVVTPHCNDQFDNADRVERLGIGRVLLARKATADRLCKLVASLSADEGAAKRAKHIGERIRAERGTEAAADAIERAARVSEGSDSRTLQA